MENGGLLWAVYAKMLVLLTALSQANSDFPS